MNTTHITYAAEKQPPQLRPHPAPHGSTSSQQGEMAQREREVPSALMSLMSSIDHLESAVGRLHERLQAVISSQPSSTPPDKATSQVTDLARAITSQTSRAHALANVLESITEALEV